MNLEEKAALALDILRTGKMVVIDAETTGVDWKRNFPVGWVICDQGRSVYIPLRHGGGGNLSCPDSTNHNAIAHDGEYYVHQFERAMLDAIRANSDPEFTLVGHNMKFDMHMLRNVEVTFGYEVNAMCTMNNEALLDEYCKDLSLHGVSTKYGVEIKKGQEMYDHLASLFGGAAKKDQMANFWRTSGSDPMVVAYAEGDGISTWQVAEKQLQKIEEEELYQVWRLECDLLHTLVNMERRGIAIDMNYAATLSDLVDSKIEEALSQLPPDFNVRSPIQLRGWLGKFRDDWPLTEKGNPSFTKSWLDTFPQGKLINAVREWRNIKESFVTPLFESHIFNGRVHTSFNQNRSEVGGSITGRLSCSGPNLMGVPKHNKTVGPVFRRLFMGNEDCLIVEADYSQIEPRLFAHFSRDENLVQGYKDGVDVHTQVAQAFGVDRATTGKRMNMGLFTGMWAKAFAGHMGIPLHEARRLWNQWHRQFPGIRQFQDANKLQIMREGQVRTLLGRIGRLEHPRFAYRATSKIIQGSQADILKYKMVEHDKTWGDDFPLQLTVHDSFVFSCPFDRKGDLKEIRGRLEDVYNHPFNLTVPCVVDVEIGANWAEATYGQ